MLTQCGHSWMMDIYTLGAMLYELVTGLPPHYSQDKDKMYTNIIYTNLSFPPGLSGDLKDFLLELLEKDPNKRLGAKGGLGEVKEHKWCKDIHWDLVYKKGLKPPYTPNLRICNFETEFLHIDYSGVIDLDSYLQVEIDSLDSDFESIILGPSLISSEVKSKLLPETLPSPPSSPISQMENIFESFLEVPVEGEKNEPKITLDTGSEFWNYLGGVRKAQSENNYCHLQALERFVEATEMKGPMTGKHDEQETIDSFTKELYDLRESQLLIPQEHKQYPNYSKIYVPNMPANYTFSSIASHNGFTKKKLKHIPTIPIATAPINYIYNNPPHDKAGVTLKEKESCTSKTATTPLSNALIDH